DARGAFRLCARDRRVEARRTVPRRARRDGRQHDDHRRRRHGRGAHLAAERSLQQSRAVRDRGRARLEGDGEQLRSGAVNYWLFKTEAETFSWDMQKKRGAKGEPWSGVRNFAAAKHMKAMKKGDLGFFYHTGGEKQIVGIVEV